MHINSFLLLFPHAGGEKPFPNPPLSPGQEGPCVPPARLRENGCSLEFLLEDLWFYRRGLLENRRSIITVVSRQVYLTLSNWIISLARLSLCNSVATCLMNSSSTHMLSNSQ